MKHYLSALLFFRDELHWIAEWLAYHRVVGFDHFYMICNDDDPAPVESVINAFAPCVTLVHRPSITQMDAIVEGFGMARGNTEWLAVFDSDEFFLPRIDDTIPPLLERMRDYSGVTAHWRVFGSSGYVSSPPHQINSFIYRAPDDWIANANVKSIVRPERVTGYHPHQFAYSFGPVEGIVPSIMRVNHYSVRSRDDYFNRRLPRNSRLWPAYGDEHFNSHDRNEIRDDEISARYYQRVCQFLGAK